MASAFLCEVSVEAKGQARSSGCLHHQSGFGGESCSQKKPWERKAKLDPQHESKLVYLDLYLDLIKISLSITQPTSTSNELQRRWDEVKKCENTKKGERERELE